MDILPPSEVVLQHFHGVWRGSVFSHKTSHPGQILLVDQDHRVFREVVLDDLEGALEEGHPGDEVVLLLQLPQSDRGESSVGGVRARGGQVPQPMLKALHGPHSCLKVKTLGHQGCHRLPTQVHFWKVESKFRGE